MKGPVFIFTVLSEIRIIRWLALIACLISAAVTISIAYVGLHFIVKFW
jgi:hypothetical protein